MGLIKIQVKQPNGTTKPSDNWHYRFNYKGKTYTKTTGTGNKTLAAKVEAKAKKDAIEGVTLNKAKTLTVQQAFDKYLDSKNHSGEHHNYATYVRKMLGIRFDKKVGKDTSIYGLDGSMSFEQLQTSDVQTLVMERRKAGYKDSTTLHELVLLSQTIKLVKKLGFAVPAIDIAEIKGDNGVKPSKGRLRWLSKEEEARLLAELSGDPYDFVLTLLRTAARHTEIAELKWDQVDIKARSISLYRSKVENESTIFMTDDLYLMMKARLNNKRDDQVYVFEASDGEARNYTSTALRKACKRAKIKDCTYHTLRHTAASRCAQAGVPMHDIQMLLGHSTPTMTMKYAHLVPNVSIRRAIDVLNKG